MVNPWRRHHPKCLSGPLDSRCFTQTQPKEKSYQRALDIEAVKHVGTICPGKILANLFSNIPCFTLKILFHVFVHSNCSLSSAHQIVLHTLKNLCYTPWEKSWAKFYTNLVFGQVLFWTNLVLENYCNVVVHWSYSLFKRKFFCKLFLGLTFWTNLLWHVFLTWLDNEFLPAAQISR